MRHRPLAEGPGYKSSKEEYSNYLRTPVDLNGGFKNEGQH